jgi:predicted  nucleic acid-binding Zn-ribbon protein
LGKGIVPDSGYKHHLAHSHLQNPKISSKEYFCSFFLKYIQNIFKNHSNLLYLCRIWYKMTEEERKLVSSFEGKLRHFMFLYEELRKENADLKHLLIQKDDEIKQLELSLKQLEAQYTDLKMARTISLYDKDIKDTKQRLSSLVREIDRCIALLNE